MGIGSTTISKISFLKKIKKARRSLSPCFLIEFTLIDLASFFVIFGVSRICESKQEV
jgi:hypothetical protein